MGLVRDKQLALVRAPHEDAELGMDPKGEGALSAGVDLLQEQGASVAGEEASGEIGDNLARSGVLKMHRGILTLCVPEGGSFFCGVCYTPCFYKKYNSRNRWVVFFSGWESSVW
jgi:hypothetical protein